MFVFVRVFELKKTSFRKTVYNNKLTRVTKYEFPVNHSPIILDGRDISLYTYSVSQFNVII